ncbi:MAG: 3'-5' exonuclease [Marinilabiliales bacterium]
MELNLKNPLIFIDIESTGINVASDRIVELTLLKITTNHKKEIRTYRVNPEIPIPEEATKIHGITNDDVKDAPVFKSIAKEIVKFIEGCDLAGYNSNKFDIPLLAEEFLRAGIDVDLKKRKFVDVQVIFYKMEQRTLEAAYKFYCDKTLENAHSSEADTIATYEVLKAQLERYETLKNDIDFLSEFSAHNKHVDFAGRVVYDDDGNEIINFGKYKGQKVIDVFKKDPAYYSWIMNGDFPLYTKKIFTAIKLKMMNK